MPVRVIWGKRDAITPLAQGRRLAAIAPGAELTVLSGVRHIPQIEDTQAFNVVLLKSITGFGP